MVMRFKKEATTWTLLRAARAGSSSSSRSKPTTRDTSKDSGKQQGMHDVALVAAGPLS